MTVWLVWYLFTKSQLEKRSLQRPIPVQSANILDPITFICKVRRNVIEYNILQDGPN